MVKVMAFRVNLGKAIALVTTLATAAAVLAAVAASPADASYEEQGLVVAADPVDFTPHILDGHVNAITTVGDRVIVGGTFTRVKDAGNPAELTRNYIVAFDRITGLVDTGFVPDVNGVVETLAPAPDGTSVFVGGVFSTVNGVSNFGLAKLDVTSGQRVTGFNATTAGKVRDLGVSGNTLYLGGDIWSVNGVPRDRLAAVDATTGAVDASFTVGTTAPRVSVDWVSELAIHPDGSEMTILGNFAEVDGLPRAQAAVIDLTGPTAQVADWSTQQFDATCSSSFWSYVRDVEYAPDGGYLVIATTGGPRPPTLCDTASRWETGVRGSDLLETWADWSGGDTLTAVAVSDVAVYIGGHQRWMNNHEGTDFAGDGAVVREGIVALDPLNGVPLSWNPGKDRGVAVWDLHLSDLGLYVGSDTDFAAGEYHAKIVQFPLAGGTTVPVPTPALLPSDLFAGEDTQLTTEVFDGASVGTPTVVPGNVMDWDDVTGVFHQAGRLYWLETSGDLLSRAFDGVTMGSVEVEPSWLSWGGRTSATWLDGKLYYTVSDSSDLRYRYFSLESGIVGSEWFVISGDGDGLDWSDTTGLMVAESKLYYTTSDGNMYSIALDAGVPVPGTETLISGPAAGDGRDWSGTDIFLLEVDSPPTVSITAPLDGETVAGEVLLTADANDDISVASVDFSVDGTLVGLDDDGSDGWSMSWDTAGHVDGAAVIAVVARDEGGQLATDAISVTVDNLEPTTVLTTPVAGAIVSGAVTVAADVTDTVGVAHAEFFADGATIGIDTDGTDGWSVNWDSTASADGPVTISVVGTDTFGRISSDEAVVTVDNLAAGVVAMVVANPAALTAGDTEVKSRLEALGYVVSAFDDAEVTAAAVGGASLVIVSSSANSYVLGTKLVSVSQPVWVAKPWLLDDMGLTGTVPGLDFGTLSGSVLTVVDPEHPLSAGYSGDVVVTTGRQTTSFGVPGAAADIVATAGGKTSTFVYAAGSLLADGSPAAGCRLHHSLFGSAPLSFTSDGWAIFDNVVAYAVNGCDAPPVDIPPTVTITAPVDGGTVIGTVTIAADAVDDDAVVEVEFLAGAVSIGIDSDGTDGWSTQWDTTTHTEGAVTVTAIATDSANQTGTDVVAVTVDNLGPSIAIVGPAPGDTVRDIVTITADTGVDPTVAQVEFFADGASVGLDVDGSDGWSQAWDTTTAADGSVTIGATATDTSARTATDSIDVTVDNASSGFVTMVVGNAASLTSGDAAVRDQFELNGYAVTLVDDNDATADDATGASFVFVASSINGGVLRDVFYGISEPLWLAKPWLLDDMGMTGSVAGTDYGNTSSAALVIVDDTHPLAAGYSGTVVVSTSSTSVSWGLPNGNAEVVATVSGHPTTFVYHSGDTLADGSTAIGCRVFASALRSSPLRWTSDGWALFDATAEYAAAGCP